MLTIKYNKATHHNISYFFQPIESFQWSDLEPLERCARINEAIGQPPIEIRSFFLLPLSHYCLCSSTARLSLEPYTGVPTGVG